MISRQGQCLISLLLCFTVFAGRAGGQTPVEFILERTGTPGLPDTVSSIFGGTLDAAGNLYIYQPAPALLLKLRAHYQTFQQIGRPGRGPGEYQFLSAIGVHDDALWTSDPVLRRVTLFDTTGAVVATYSLNTQPVANRFSRGSVAGWFADGAFLVRTEADASSVAGGLVGSVPLLKVGQDGVVLDTLARLNIEHGSSEVQVEPGGPTSYGRQPFDDGTLWTLSADNRFLYLVDRKVPTGDGDPGYGVTKLDANGVPLWSKRFAYQPSKIAAAQIDSAVARRARLMNLFRRHDPARLNRAIRASLYIPASMPPVTAIVAAGSGVWLRRPWISGDDQWTVIDGDGEVIGRVNAPHGIRILWTDGSAVWGTTEDSDGLPILSSFRVVSQ